MSDVVRDQIAALTAALPRLSSSPESAGYGIDIVCVDDIDARMTETELDSMQSLSQDLFHRLTTPHGSLPDDLDYGLDLRGKLSTGQTPDAQRNLSSDVEAECMKDPRVLNAAVTLTVSGSTWRVSVAVTPYALLAVNSFELIMVVTSGEAILEAIQNATV